MNRRRGRRKGVAAMNKFTATLVYRTPEVA
jgi:hypothetical protein